MDEKRDSGIWFRLVSFLLGAGIAGILILILLYELRGVEQVFSEKNMSYTEFSAVLLTTVAVVVAGMGVMLAFLAFVGFQHIRDQAREAADKGAREMIKTSIKEGGDLRIIIEEEIYAIAREKRMKPPVGAPEGKAKKAAMDAQDANEPEFEEAP